jgi:hypothetical protein
MKFAQFPLLTHETLSLSCILPFVNSNIFSLGEVLVMMSAMQCVDKGCPFQIDNSLFNSKYKLEQSFDHQKLITNCISLGFQKH